MTELSPAARAVLDATYEEMDYAPQRHVRWAAAAALRAAAYQVAPEKPEPCAHFEGGELNVNWDDWRACQRIRAAILAIATELENAQ